MILAIAWRNVWRNKLRSLVMITAVTLGLTGCIFSVAWMNGMVQQMITSSIETQVSNVQIHNPEYGANNEIKYFIKNADSVLKLISKNPEVKAVSRRTKTSAMASTATTGTGIMIEGVIPSEEKKVTDLYTKLIEGNYFETESRSAPMILGEKLSHKLNAKTGNKVIVTIQTLSDTITYGAFRVVGIFKTQNSQFDETNVFVKNDDLCKLTGFNPENTTEIAVKLKDNKQSEAVADELSNKFPKLEVQTWMQIRPEFQVMNSMMTQMLYIFLVVILLALAFGIVNAMLMAVMERVKEIGMLMAVGMNKGRVFRMIMLETIFLSLTGGFLGVIISYILISWTGSTGIDMSMVGEGLSEVGYASVAYPEIENSYYLVTTILVIVTAVLASIYPARKALKLKPAEAIRDEG